ncbi:MAG: hypothetical protein WKF75_02865 [Singulisphaera sp.]
MMTSTELVDPAAKSALGLGPEEWPKAAQVELTPVGVQAMKVIVTVARSEKETRRSEAAQDFLRELLSRSKVVIGQMASPRRREVQDRVEALTKRRDELRVQVEDLRKRSRAAEIRPSPPSALFGTGSVQAQRQQIEAQLATRKPRLDAIKAAARAQDQLGRSMRRTATSSRPARRWDALAAAVEQGKADRLGCSAPGPTWPSALPGRGGEALALAPPPPNELASPDIEVRVLQAHDPARRPHNGPRRAPAEDAQRSGSICLRPRTN